MFTGAKDFNINRLGIVNAGRDVNINVITTGSSPRMLDLQALFSGNLEARGATLNRMGSSIVAEGGDGGGLVTQLDKNRRQGFKRAIYGAFGKRKEQMARPAEDVAKMATVDEPQQPQTEEVSSAEVYVRALLGSGNGLPCWNPNSHGWGPGTEGVVPGDVGVYSTDGGFEKIFNLWDDELGIQTVAESINADLYQPPRRAILLRRDALQEGEVIVQGLSAQRSGRILQFTQCEAPEAAVLALTSSADLTTLEDLPILHLRECIVQHAGLLYVYANRVRRLRAGDSALYVITGCVKSDTWALGALRTSPVGTSLSLVPVLGSIKPVSSPAYQWVQPKSIWADLFTGDSPGGRKNQSLFLRGFKIGFSSAFRHRMANSERSGLSMPAERGPMEGTYHPCDLINARMLHQTGVDIALSHDDNWRFLFQNTSGKGADLLNLEALNFTGHSRPEGRLQISIRNGVAYIESTQFGDEEDKFKRENRQKDLNCILPKSLPQKLDDVPAKVIPESELSLIPAAGGLRYQPVAHGNTADIYLAVRKAAGKEVKVAVKISRGFKLHAMNQRGDGDVFAAIRLEYTILSMLSHPNVLRLEGLAKIDEMPTHGLVLEYKPLGNLSGFTRRNIHFSRLEMAKGIVCGLDYIHSMGIVHGNIEPRKILVDMDARTGEFFPLLCGFNSSKISGSEGYTSKGFSSGPIWYRAPELMHGPLDGPVPGSSNELVTYASDMYSFGVLSLELLTGKCAYAADGFSTIKFSDRLVDLIGPSGPGFEQYRMIDPTHRFVWTVLDGCWKANPSERISAKEAHKQLCDETHADVVRN